LATIADVAKSYNQYCPVARALELVGERWSLLIVRELIEEGQLRYSDLHSRLEHCGTNILAARLKDLEGGGVIRRRRLPPPAASTVYELTEYGQGLQPVLHQLAHWGARALGPPTTPGQLEPGWLPGALRMALPQSRTGATIEFRIGDEAAYLEDGAIRAGSSARPDAVVAGDAAGLFRMLVDRELDGVTVRGSKTVVRQLLETLPAPCAYPPAAEDVLAAAS
jgi:DNA-binding HxlR family transcriptional regulator